MLVDGMEGRAYDRVRIVSQAIARDYLFNGVL